MALWSSTWQRRKRRKRSEPKAEAYAWYDLELCELEWGSEAVLRYVAWCTRFCTAIPNILELPSFLKGTLGTTLWTPKAPASNCLVHRGARSYAVLL
jgi:hypothetical protein